MKVKRILVAVKPWERGLPLAANHARELAQVVDAQIQIVGTAFDATVAAGSDRGEAAARRAQDCTVAAARVELERLAASLRDWGAQVTTRAVWGVPAYEAILTAARAWAADLLVVGTHVRETLHTRLTDTDWQLMRRAACPLLLVKRQSFSGYRKIVAAVDSVHAHDEPSGLDRAVLGAGRTVEAVHRRAVTELADQFGVAGTEISLVEDSAPQAIVDTVAQRRAELLVIGTQQRRGALGAAVGSTAELVVGAVPCDVLIVPAPVDSAARVAQR